MTLSLSVSHVLQCDTKRVCAGEVKDRHKSVRPYLYRTTLPHHHQHVASGLVLMMMIAPESIQMEATTTVLC